MITSLSNSSLEIQETKLEKTEDNTFSSPHLAQELEAIHIAIFPECLYLDTT